MRKRIMYDEFVCSKCKQPNESKEGQKLGMCKHCKNDTWFRVWNKEVSK